MSEAKFTKGEWVIDYRGTLGHVKSIKGGAITPTVARYDFVSPSLTNKEKKANAHLIAAAPDMYKMLERLKSIIEDYDYDLFCERATGEWSEPEISTEIEKLLTKARGQI